MKQLCLLSAGPQEQWGMLVNAYRRANELYDLTSSLARAAKDLQVKPADTLNFDEFDSLWNHQR